MPFTEHANTVWFGKEKDIPVIRITFDDKTKQKWFWDEILNDWNQSSNWEEGL